MNILFRKFGVKVTAAIVLCMVAVVVFSGFLIYQITVKAQFESLRHRLKIIAQVAAQTVSAENVSSIPLNRTAIKVPAYQIVSDQLRKIKAANTQIKFVYILTKVDTSGIWKFVADADPVYKNGLQAFPGDTYNAARFPELIKAFDAPGADRKIETDEWGQTLSGYAPIRDTLGRPIAVLGVDMDAKDVYMMERKIYKRFLIVLFVGIAAALILGVIISQRVIAPVSQLIAGTRYIAQGNMHYHVDIKGDDEIGDLADSFNQMSASLELSRKKLLTYFYDAVTSLIRILEIRDHYTLGHSESVARYSELIALRMGMAPKTVEFFKKVVLLHDIGKVGVRDSVLLKPDKLTQEEWESIKLHPVLGEQILKPLLHDPQMLSVIRNHHERHDGGGYPDGLKGDQINIFVAITTVADSYDAMTSTRSYRKARPSSEAMEQLKKNKGAQFNPDVVETFLAILHENRSV